MKRKFEEEDDSENEFEDLDQFEEEEELSEEENEEEEEEDDDDDDEEEENEDNEEEVYGTDSDEEEDDDNDDEDRDNQIEQLEKELSSIPFNQIAKIQQKMGLKEFNKTYSKISNKRNIIDDEKINDAKQKIKSKNSKIEKPIAKRKDKNRPMEITSKRPVGRYREVVQVKKKKTRDPRFDNLSGKYNEDLFKKSYKFLSEMEDKEMKMIQENMKKTKNPLEKEKLNRLYQSLKSKKQSEIAKEKKQSIKREWRKKEMARVKEGKKPFFLKRADLKRMELIDKYKNTKSGALDKVLEKRRKRNANKEHRYMPRKRNN